MDLPELQTLAIEPLAHGIAVLRINRPDRMNSQTVTMFTEYNIAARALRSSSMRGNPVALSQDDLRAILARAA